MMAWGEFSILLAGMALVAYACRALGFLAMRYVPMTGRVEAALKATPISVMCGICAIAAWNGGPPEWAGGAAVLGMMRALRNDILAAFAGILAVALVRAAGY